MPKKVPLKPIGPGFLAISLPNGEQGAIKWGRNRQAIGASAALDTNDSNSTQAGHTLSFESGAKTSESKNPITVTSELGDDYVVVTPSNSPRKNSQSPTTTSLKDGGSLTLASSKDGGSR